MLHVSVLYRIEVRVVDVGCVVAVISDGVFPIPALPDPAFAPIAHDGRSRLGDGKRFGKGGFYCAPARGEVRVAWGESPHAVHVVRQYDPGVDVEWRAGADLA